jgi:TetR/AcrR family transcriptional regulator, regulator of cefoperazone and chloramphenicol sensitivity
MRGMPLRSPNGQTRSDTTRAALIAAATEVFARSGFEAVGTREIAMAAQVHPALIGYHFGGKDGLYLAVFENMASTMEQRIDPALAGIDAAMAQPASPAAASERALALLSELCDAMMTTLADEASGPWGPLMMREQQAPTPAFDLIYERFMKRMLDTMTKLLRVVDPRRSDAAARLTVVTILGQMIVFRASRAGVMRHLGWQHMGAAHLAQAKAAVRDNVRRMCAPEKSG